MSGSRSYRSSLVYGVLSFMSTAGLGIFTSIAVARVYGIDVIGLYALVLAPTGAMWFLSSMREQAGLVRELASLEFRAPRVTGLFTAVLAFSTVLTLVVAAIVMTIVYFFYRGPVGHPELFAPALVSMIGYVVIQNVAWNFDMIFSAFRAGRELFAVRLSSTVAYVALAVAFGLIWNSVWSLVAATIISNGMALVHRVEKSRRLMRLWVPRSDIREGFDALPRMVMFGLKLTPGSIADGVANEAPTWLLGAMSSVQTVGAFNRAWTLGTRFRDVNYRITEVLFPTLVDRREAGDQEGVDRAMVDSVRYQCAAMLLIASAGGGAAYGVMGLFGPGFDRAANALALILLMPVIVGIASIQGTALVAVDRAWMTSVISMARAAVTVGLMFVLTLTMGLTGTALASVLGYMFSATWFFLATRKHMGQPVHTLWLPRQMLGQVLAYAGGFVTARTVDDVIDGPIGLIAALIAGAVVYLALFLAVGGLNSRDRRRLKGVRRKLPARFGGLPAVRPDAQVRATEVGADGGSS